MRQVPPLRCKGPEFLLCSLACVDFDGKLLPTQDRKGVFRMLSLQERLKCQGHPEYKRHMFGKTSLMKATGNAYAIPAVASALLPVLEEVSAGLEINNSTCSIGQDGSQVLVTPPRKRVRLTTKTSPIGDEMNAD